MDILFSVLATGFFTLTAALGAQKMAANREKENRKEDQIFAHNEAQHHAIDSYLLTIGELQLTRTEKIGEEIDYTRSELSILEQASVAVTSRSVYVRRLINETQRLNIHVSNIPVSRVILEMLERLQRESSHVLTLHEALVSLDPDTSSHRLLDLRHEARYGGGNFELSLTTRLFKLIQLAKTEFGYKVEVKDKGLFTPFSPQQITNPSTKASPRLRASDKTNVRDPSPEHRPPGA